MRLCFHYALYRYMFKHRKNEKKKKKIKNNIIDSWNRELKIGRKKKRERSATCVFSFRSEHRFNVRDAIEDENSSLKKIATFIGMHRNRDKRPSFWRARATGSYSRDAATGTHGTSWRFELSGKNFHRSWKCKFLVNALKRNF